MSLRPTNIERMLQLGLTRTAEALEEEREIADIDRLGLNERLAMMRQREAERHERKILGLARQRDPVDVNDGARPRLFADVGWATCHRIYGWAPGPTTRQAAGRSPPERTRDAYGWPDARRSFHRRCAGGPYRRPRFHGQGAPP